VLLGLPQILGENHVEAGFATVRGRHLFAFVRTLRYVGAVKRLMSFAPEALATILLALIALKAALAVDLVYDSLSYHLPFAARRAHLLSSWQFQRPPAAIDPLTGYYDGFPALADLAKGWAWRLTGWPEVVNLFGLASLLAFLAYVRFMWRVPFAWVAIGLLAVPAIQTAAAGNYVDIPANIEFAIVLLSICDLYIRPERFTRPGPWLILFAAAFAAAHTKLQSSVFVCLTMPFVLPPIFKLLGERRRDPLTLVKFGALYLAACLAIAGNLIKNLIRFGNPFYPLDTKIAGLHFPGPITDDAWLLPGRPYFGMPEFFQWLLSVLEYKALGGRETVYDNGMGNVPWDSPAAAMGGFFSALVVASVAFFVVAVARRRDRVSFVLAACLAITTLIVANFPNAHNLRYETFLMVVLITGCLLLTQRDDLRDLALAYRIVLFSSLVFVVSVTGGIYFKPAYNPMQKWVADTGAEAILRRVVKESGDVICLEQGPGKFDTRFTIVFSPAFHQELNREIPYAVREGDCTGRKTISGWR
jgi:hypothetical protein